MADLRDSNSPSPTPENMLDTSAASPTSPGSAGSSQASTPLDPYDAVFSSDFPKRVPSLRSISDPNKANLMHPTSTPQGVLQNARIPLPQPHSGLSAEHLAKTRAFLQSRMGTSPNMSANSSPRQTPKPGPPLPAQLPNLQGSVPNLSNGFNPMKISVRPGPGGASSAPAVPRAGLSARRGLNLAMGDNPVTSPASPPSMNGMRLPTQPQGSFSEFSKYIDTKHGYLKFDEARVFDKGVEFADGQMFSISLDEIEVLDELGKGNYGTVYKVKHAKPTLPRFGPGLTGFRPKHPRPPSFMNGCPPAASAAAPHLRQVNGVTTGRIMAMKEIRLELDEQKFKNILKELIILHRCSSPFIIDFYGAFFQEGSVYMCIEYMDGGSLDKLYTGGIPEGVLKKIAYATVSGLLELKEKHQIIHRDVKPTNILANTSGQIKICDFGVSGNLVASKAMTNIGCQSYMAPERISGGALVGLETNDGSYDVTSDIWSLGLTIIECATGKYPYPPEVSSSILGQLNAIVEGDPPDLPSDGFSNTAREFVKSCLNKVPSKRPTYKNLLQHSWLASLSKPGTIAEVDEESGLANSVETMSITASSMQVGDQEVADWVKNALAKSLEEEARHKGLPNGKTKPALHAAPLGL